MSQTQTAELIYSLSLSPCPIPFPAQPSYPIQPTLLSPTRAANTIPSTYLSALYAPSHDPLADFAHRLLALRASAAALSSTHDLLRSLLLPIHDLDYKYRQLVPGALSGEGGPDTDEDALMANLELRELPDDEKTALLEAKKRWELARAEQVSASRSSESATGQNGKATAEKWTTDTETLEDWLTELELLETLLQSLLLLTIMSLPLPESPRKRPKKRRDPERHAATLDPALLLDFLTDRMAIWRTMREFDDTAALATGTQSNEQQQQNRRDIVMVWWDDIVQPLFAPHLSFDLLPSHKLKLFPTPEQSTSSDPLLRSVPAPSPFKQRSLLSLDRSARKKTRAANEAAITESPTMKRLGLGSKSRSFSSFPTSTMGDEAGTEGDGDGFKVPTMPPPGRRRLGPTESGKMLQQLGRQEVSLARKPSLGPAAKKRKPESPRRLQPQTSFAAFGAAFRPGAAPPLGGTFGPPREGMTPVKKKTTGWVVPDT